MNIEKKSNKELLELKVKLSQDFQKVKMEIVNKIDHWEVIKSYYNNVIGELKKRGIE